MDNAAEAIAEPAQAWWQHSTELLAGLSAADRFVHANPAWNSFLGWDTAVLQGQSFVRLLHPQDAARAATGLTLARTRPEHQFEARCRHARGHYVGVSWSFSHSPGGMLLASGRRCTQRVAADPPRAKEAASARLQRVLAMGRLAGGVAHDFNNLLQALRNALELVRLQPGDAAGVQRLSESALRVLDHGAHLTAQLLASSGAQRLQLGAVPIGPLLHGMRSRIERHLPPRVRLQMHVTGDAGTVMADATQLESAILNLVLNACDAMQGLRRGGVVTVSCEGALLSGDHELPTGEYLRVSVSDVGTGMSEAVRERAFEPFFTTRPLAEGGHARGLGLSQVHGFSRQCGGSARIMSTGPGGTTVCMLLPLLGPAEVGSAHERIEAPEEPVALVLADSNSPLRQLLCDSLRLLGHRAVPVADAPAMVAALQRHRTADVVLIDVTQPRRDGHSGSELAQRLRLAWPELGVVLVGSEAAAVSPERHQPVLQAPFDLAALSQVMDQAIESAGPAEHEP